MVGVFEKTTNANGSEHAASSCAALAGSPDQQNTQTHTNRQNKASELYAYDNHDNNHDDDEDDDGDVDQHNSLLLTIIITKIQFIVSFINILIYKSSLFQPDHITDARNYISAEL